jgi:hypothetical protein
MYSFNHFNYLSVKNKKRELVNDKEQKTFQIR